MHRYQAANSAESHLAPDAADTLSLPVVDELNSKDDQRPCQLACVGRRPTESFQDTQLPFAAPIASTSAHQEPPLLPPQRPEHKV